MRVLGHRQPFTAHKSSLHLPKTRSVVVKSNRHEPIGEDVLARLRAAEEEAARLRKQLEIAQQAKGAPAAASVDVLEKPKRIDSVDSRETIFTGKSQSRVAWLSEGDVEFFVGSGVGEAGSSQPRDPEAEATVQRRLLIGGVLAAGALAFALVPTEALRPKPQRPLFFYVVPLLRVSNLLAEAQGIIEGGDWEQLRNLLARITGSPNNIRDNLDAVVVLLGDASQGGSREKQARATQLRGELVEYLDAMDYNKYFDAMPAAAVTGAKAAEFVQFSGAARSAAAARLSQLLQLVPQEALAVAMEQAKLY